MRALSFRGRGGRVLMKHKKQCEYGNKTTRHWDKNGKEIPREKTKVYALCGTCWKYLCRHHYYQHYHKMPRVMFE